jgi:hypothetical protein
VATEQPGVPAPLTGAYALLAPDVGALVRQVLGRRSAELGTRLAHQDDVSEDEASEVQWVLYTEFAAELDDDWEPSTYGKTVDDAIGAFVTKFVIERDS